jgi:hypothetical protein
MSSQPQPTQAAPLIPAEPNDLGGVSACRAARADGKHEDPKNRRIEEDLSRCAALRTALGPALSSGLRKEGTGGTLATTCPKNSRDSGWPNALRAVACPLTPAVRQPFGRRPASPRRSGLRFSNSSILRRYRRCVRLDIVLATGFQSKPHFHQIAIGRAAARQNRRRTATYITKHSTANGGNPRNPRTGISKILMSGRIGTL